MARSRKQEHQPTAEEALGLVRRLGCDEYEEFCFGVVRMMLRERHSRVGRLLGYYLCCPVSESERGRLIPGSPEHFITCCGEREDILLVGCEPPADLVKTASRKTKENLATDEEIVRVLLLPDMTRPAAAAHFGRKESWLHTRIDRMSNHHRERLGLPPKVPKKFRRPRSFR